MQLRLGVADSALGVENILMREQGFVGLSPPLTTSLIKEFSMRTVRAYRSATQQKILLSILLPLHSLNQPLPQSLI